jgi:saccharopine dehydrogenase-like NADP-dependent oxidoreductase
MFTVALFGAGKIGEAIVALLAKSGRYKVRVCDIDPVRAERLAQAFPGVATGHALTLKDEAATLALLKDAHAVMSALPYYCNPQVAELAVRSGVHYLDLTEDVEVTRQVTRLAKKGGPCLIPQCGLAPGFISVAAMHLARSFHAIDTVKMRVGALPIYPSNRLKYNLTWSTEGLINEYGNMCEVIDEGKKQQAFPLEGYERFSLDGNEYEAFNTSGGLGSLCETLAGKVRRLDYKSVRYPGHRELVALLMNDLRFNEDRSTLKNVFERSIPTTHQDKCLIFVEVVGTVERRLVQRTYASTVYNCKVGAQHFGAIQVTTASGICTPLDLLLTGKIKDASGNAASGVVKCEEISLMDFLDNEFGNYYRDEKALSGISH